MINGLIFRLLMQDIHPDGFKQLVFNEFTNGVGEIDEGLLDQFVA